MTDFFSVIARALSQNSENTLARHQAIDKDVGEIVNPVAQALMAPGDALRGEYNGAEVNADGSVNPFNAPLMNAASNMAGVVSLGSAPMPRPIGSLGVGGTEAVSDLLQQARARIAAREAKAAEIIGSGKSNVRMKGKAGMALVGPDMSVPGKFRVTYFDPQGVPNGHVELPTYSEAIKRAMLDGFSE